MSALAPKPKYQSFSFDTLGAEFSGTITEPPQDSQARKFGTNELDFWPDGQPKIQTRIVAMMADGEVRAIYASGRMARAITSALIEVGASDIEVGGQISVKWAKGQGKTGSPKEYEATYTAPAPGSYDDEEPPF